jgi:ubiquinone/menaquinone biosynthesis C-methylase UbiE
LPTDVERTAEQQKYLRAYQRPNYRMKLERMTDAVQALADLPRRGAYLDISCGHGEMLEQAERLHFHPVQGTEIVDSLIDGARVVYGECHSLPFPEKSFDVVSLYDVIEHLIPPDDEAVCREMARIARHHVMITANNKSSLQKNGDELHVNRRPYEEWDALFRIWFDGAEVKRLQAHEYISEPWRVDL